MEVFDLNKAFDELFPPKEPDLKNTAEAPSILGIDLAALAAGGAGLGQWTQFLLPAGSRA